MHYAGLHVWKVKWNGYYYDLAAVLLRMLTLFANWCPNHIKNCNILSGLMSHHSKHWCSCCLVLQVYFWVWKEVLNSKYVCHRIKWCIKWCHKMVHKMVQLQNRYMHWKKLEVDLTQHGSPQLEDLGQYHQAWIATQKYINTIQSFTYSAWIFSEFIQQ